MLASLCEYRRRSRPRGPAWAGLPPRKAGPSSGVPCGSGASGRPLSARRLLERGSVPRRGVAFWPAVGAEDLLRRRGRPAVFHVSRWRHHRSPLPRRLSCAGPGRGGRSAPAIWRGRWRCARSWAFRSRCIRLRVRRRRSPFWGSSSTRWPASCGCRGQAAQIEVSAGGCRGQVDVHQAGALVSRRLDASRESGRVSGPVVRASTTGSGSHGAAA